ncbi:hypothetical protein K1T71_009095 [Dendrolimus kikuchii]|uniref:Uncharacterized protein n=1 Tax=Dendrolimus kikuchii TaxID=765133 RepID=A0ACC1CU60_9NEOP|nr:hypothetical protein K1T71_009095 [Dendrolimus kikuchii]
MSYIRAIHSLTSTLFNHAYNIYQDVISITQLVIFYLFSFVHISSARTNLLVTRVGPCYDEPRTIITVSEFSLSTKSFNTSLTGEMNITDNIEDGWSVKATMKKCLDIRNIDTCDHFKSFLYIRDGCINYQEDGEAVYSILFHYVEPRMSCPIEAGRYSIKDLPLYTADTLAVHESKISTSVFGYTFRLDVFDNLERKILCVEAYLQLLYVREHSWVKGKKDITTTTETASAENDDVE